MAKFAVLLACLAVLVHSGSALNCYKCLDGCEVSKAEQGECGKNIGPSQSAVCYKEDRKGHDKPIRKCTIVNKGDKPPCPTDSTCYDCNTDLCNAAMSLAGLKFGYFAVFGVVLCYFAPKFFLIN